MTDNGPGIKPGDEAKLFKPFSKLADDKNLNPNGSGLGLNICKLICRNLGGDIKLESSDEDGTKFTFWVTVKKTNEYDIDMLTPGRDIVLQINEEVNTQARLNMNAFLSHHTNFEVLTRNDLKLSIICADDAYYNLEALRLIFQKLGLLEVCHFFANGREVIDYCKQNV